MTTQRVMRRDGTIYDAPPGYVFQDGESVAKSMLMLDGAPVALTDEQVLAAVRDEMRPKDTSRLSAAQLKRAFVAMKLPEQADEILAKSESFIEGAFKALTAGMKNLHLVNSEVAETRADGTVRDAAPVVVDGFTVTSEMAHAAGYDSATAMVTAHEGTAAVYDMTNAARRDAWRDPASIADTAGDPWDAYRRRLAGGWMGDAA